MYNNLRPDGEDTGGFIVFDVCTKSFISTWGQFENYVPRLILRLMTSTTPFSIYDGSFMCYLRSRVWHCEGVDSSDRDRFEPNDQIAIQSDALVDERSQPYFDASPMTVLIHWGLVFAYQNHNVLLIRYKEEYTDAPCYLESAVVIIPDRYRFTDISTYGWMTYVVIIDTITEATLCTVLKRPDSHRMHFEHDTYSGNQRVDIGLCIV